MRRAWIRAVPLALLAVTCGDVDVLDVTVESTAQVRGAGVIGGLLADVDFADLLELDLTTTEELDNQGVERHEIDSVRLVELRLAVVAPPDQDLVFLSEVSFFVEAEGLPRRRIASGGPFPAGEREVELSIDDVELVEYVAAPSMDITTVTSGRAPEQDTTVQAVVGLEVDVNLRGAACGE